MKSLSIEMLQSHPSASARTNEDRSSLLVALGNCTMACTLCADACLAEKEMAGRLRGCIRLNQDCADLCEAAARLLARPAESSAVLLHAALHACTLACQLCADECDTHADRHAHCRHCATACRRCQESCNHYLGQTGSSGVAEASPSASARSGS